MNFPLSELHSLSTNELVGYSRSCDAEQSEAARAALASKFEPLIKKCVKSISAEMGLDPWNANVLANDLLQEGWEGFFKALSLFDPAIGTPLGYFAKKLIRHEISHFLRKHYRYSKHSIPMLESTHGDSTVEFDPGDIYPSDVDVIKEVQSKEVVETILAFLSQLPESQKNKFLLALRHKRRLLASEM